MSQADLTLADWKHQQELAEQMLPIIGRLYRDRGVALTMYGRTLASASTIDIIKAHRYARQLSQEQLSLDETFAVLQALAGMELGPAKLDIGQLAQAYRESGGASLPDFLSEQLSQIVGQPDDIEARDVVLYGFGRIGRLLARLLVERSGSGQHLRLRAIVVRKGKGNDLQKRASLLRRDSVHGPFNGTITVDEARQAIVANGNFIQIIYSDAPDQVDYSQYGIKDALVVDNTGKWRDAEGLGLHLKARGAAKALLTAPGKGDMKNVVFGVNHSVIQPEDRIISAASCTTNAITPALKLLNDTFGVEVGHVETVHSYTNDQNLIDNYHSADRRGRSAPLNMVLTETGAAKAVAKALPELAGKLTGNAIRVPTPNVSMAIMNLTLGRETTRDELNALFREASLRGPLRDQIDFTASTELVSSDLVGSRHAGVVDSQATIVNGKHAVVYIWYDNEFGYSCQVVRVMEQMAGVSYPVIGE